MKKRVDIFPFLAVEPSVADHWEPSRKPLRVARDTLENTHC